MNYIISFAIIMTGSVMATLTRNADAHWLWISDINVAIALFIAWCLDKGRSKGININISVSR